MDIKLIIRKAVYSVIILSMTVLQRDPRKDCLLQVSLCHCMFLSSLKQFPENTVV